MLAPNTRFTLDWNKRDLQIALQNGFIYGASAGHYNLRLLFAVSVLKVYQLIEVPTVAASERPMDSNVELSLT